MTAVGSRSRRVREQTGFEVCPAAIERRRMSSVHGQADLAPLDLLAQLDIPDRIGGRRDRGDGESQAEFLAESLEHAILRCADLGRQISGWAGDLDGRSWKLQPEFLSGDLLQVRAGHTGWRRSLLGLLFGSRLLDMTGVHPQCHRRDHRGHGDHRHHCQRPAQTYGGVRNARPVLVARSPRWCGQWSASITAVIARA